MSVQVKTEWRGKQEKKKKLNARKMHTDTDTAVIGFISVQEEMSGSNLFL